MGWPKISESKAGNYKTSEDVLIEYEALGLPGIKELQSFRSLSVGLNTFIKGWEKLLIENDDGTYRIYPNCNSFSTKSHRHSMKDPNFQQTPSSAEMAKAVKKLFTVPKLERIEIEQNGKIYSGFSDEYILTKRGKIKFSEVVETDEIIGEINESIPSVSEI